MGSTQPATRKVEATKSVLSTAKSASVGGIGDRGGTMAEGEKWTVNGSCINDGVQILNGSGSDLNGVQSSLSLDVNNNESTVPDFNAIPTEPSSPKKKQTDKSIGIGVERKISIDCVGKSFR